MSPNTGGREGRGSTAHEPIAVQGTPWGTQRKAQANERIMTPYEKLKSLPRTESHLTSGLKLESLDAIAVAISDNDAARQPSEAKWQLSKAIAEQDRRGA